MTSGKAAASGGDGGGFGGGGGGGTEKTIYSMTFIELESAVRNILGEEIVSMKMTDFLKHIWMFDHGRTTPGAYTLPPDLSDKTVHEVCQDIWNKNGGESIPSGSSSSSYLQSHQSVGDVFLQAGIVWEEFNLTELLASENGDEWIFDDLIENGAGGLDGMTVMCDVGADIVVTSNMEEQKLSKLERRRKNDRIRRAQEKAKKTEREATIEALTETNRKLMVENQQLREQIRGIEELEAYKREMEENVRKFKEEEDRKFQAKKRKIEKKGGNK